MKNINFIMYVLGFIMMIFLGISSDSEQKTEEKEEVIEEIDFGKLLEKEYTKNITVTVYNPVEEQCDNDPLITADNSLINIEKLKAGKIKWIAISRDLFEIYNYGDKIKISGDPDIDGIYEIHDTMNKRFKNRVDILVYPGKIHGKWENLSIERV